MQVPKLSPAAILARFRPTAALLFAALSALALSGCGGGSGTVEPPAPPPPVIVTLGMPDGQVGVAYSFTVQALSGRPPYTWAVSAGTLPAGLTLDPATGQVSGTPTTAETRTFTLRVTDTLSQSDTQEYTVAIGAPAAFVERVSLAVGGAQANSDSGTPSLSDNGDFMAFTSFATNLVASDTNNFPDVFLRDFSCDQNVLVSVSSSGTQANNQSFAPVVSGLRSSDDHVMVAYVSAATNLVSGDTNGGRDIFVTALDAAACPPVVVDTIRISVATDGAQATLSDTQSPSSLLPSISANGLVVAYQSDAVNLDPPDSNQRNDIYVTELAFSGGALSIVRTRRISLFPGRLAFPIGSTTPDIFTADSIGRTTLTMTDDEHIGREVQILQGIGNGQIRPIVGNNATTLFVDPPWNPVPNATSVFRILTRENIPADIFSDTTLGNADLDMQNDETIGHILEIVAGTGDGQRRVITTNTDTTFTVTPAWSPVPDATRVFRFIRQGNAESLRGRVSPDAGTVIFDTGSALEEEDDNAAFDVFAYDLATEEIERLTRTFMDRPSNGTSNAAALTGSADLALVLSAAINLDFTLDPTEADIFSSTTIGNFALNLAPDALKDQFVVILEGVGRNQGRTITANTSTTLTVDPAFSPVPDDTSVFAVTDDTNNQTDLFLLDRNTGEFSRVSLTNAGEQDNGIEDPNARISANGDAIVYSSLASNLVPDDRNNVRDIYLRNLDAIPNTTSRISRALGGTNPNAECIDPAFSLDGSTIAFASIADNLVADDTNDARDIFLVTTGINDPPGFVFSTVSSLRVGRPFAKNLTAVGGSRPLFWSLGSGSLPPGLFLDSSAGTLTGTPQQAGRYNFTLVVSDSARPPRQTRKTLTLVVEP